MQTLRPVLVWHGRVPVCEPACEPAFGSRVLTMGSVVGHLPCFWAESALTGTPLRGVVALIFHRGVADVWHLWLTKSDDFRPGLGDLVWFSSFMVWRRCVARLRARLRLPGPKLWGLWLTKSDDFGPGAITGGSVCGFHLSTRGPSDVARLRLPAPNYGVCG